MNWTYPGHYIYRYIDSSGINYEEHFMVDQFGRVIKLPIEKNHEGWAETLDFIKGLPE